MERLDVDGLARQLIAEFGDDAAVVAVPNADNAMDRGDFQEFHKWNRVAAVVRKLRNGDKF